MGERNRVGKIYYKAAKEIRAAIIIMKEGYGLRGGLMGGYTAGHIKRFQRILEYQARLHGLNVVYVDPRNTSRMCPAVEMS